MSELKHKEVESFLSVAAGGEYIVRVDDHSYVLNAVAFVAARHTEYIVYIDRSGAIRYASIRDQDEGLAEHIVNESYVLRARWAGSSLGESERDLLLESLASLLASVLSGGESATKIAVDQGIHRIQKEAASITDGRARLHFLLGVGMSGGCAILAGIFALWWLLSWRPVANPKDLPDLIDASERALAYSLYAKWQWWNAGTEALFGGALGSALAAFAQTRSSRQYWGTFSPIRDVRYQGVLFSVSGLIGAFVALIAWKGGLFLADLGRTVSPSYVAILIAMGGAGASQRLAPWLSDRVLTSLPSGVRPAKSEGEEDG